MKIILLFGICSCRWYNSPANHVFVVLSHKMRHLLFMIPTRPHSDCIHTLLGYLSVHLKDKRNNVFTMPYMISFNIQFCSGERRDCSKESSGVPQGYDFWALNVFVSMYTFLGTNELH